jgi:hypothetical protein
MHEDTKPFWFIHSTNSGDTLKFNALKLVRFLKLNGWGYYKTHESRTAKNELFQNDNGILRLHDADSARRWVANFLENTDEKHFEQDGVLYVDGADQFFVLDAWISVAATLWSNVLRQIPYYSEEGFTDTTEIHLFRDEYDTAHIQFRNGIVKITSDSITLIPLDSIKEKGAIWESEQLRRNIHIEKVPRFGLFEKFCQKSFNSRKSNTRFDEVKESEFELDEDQYRGMRLAYGYLIHSYKQLDELKCILLIDSEGTYEKPEGRNGKSLITSSLTHFKKMVTIAGRQWMSDDKFVYSDVTPETRLVLINDVTPAFGFDKLFNIVTDDMQVEGKGTNKKVIPKEKSPKIAITTNEVLAGIGGSYEGRQHIVEMGNYWNRVNKAKEKPSDKKYMGKMLFGSGFDDEDWNQFYNFGFRCVQEFLRDGLIQAENQEYKTKALVKEIEGTGGDGEVTAWMVDWVENKRTSEFGYSDETGISENDLYSLFSKDNTIQQFNWDIKRFRTSFFAFIVNTPKLEYNEHLAANGDTITKRRWLLGAAGQQERHIKIT